MQGLGFFAAILVGGLAGWIASRFMGANTGLIMNVILGILGAVLANFLFGLIGLGTSGGWIMQGFIGFVGACILIAVLRMLRGR